MYRPEPSSFGSVRNCGFDQFEDVAVPAIPTTTTTTTTTTAATTTTTTTTILVTTTTVHPTKSNVYTDLVSDVQSATAPGLPAAVQTSALPVCKPGADPSICGTTVQGTGSYEAEYAVYCGEYWSPYRLADGEPIYYAWDADSFEDCLQQCDDLGDCSAISFSSTACTSNCLLINEVQERFTEAALDDYSLWDSAILVSEQAALPSVSSSTTTTSTTTSSPTSHTPTPSSTTVPYYVATCRSSSTITTTSSSSSHITPFPNTTSTTTTTTSTTTTTAASCSTCLPGPSVCNDNIAVTSGDIFVVDCNANFASPQSNANSVAGSFLDCANQCDTYGNCLAFAFNRAEVDNLYPNCYFIVSTTLVDVAVTP